MWAKIGWFRECWQNGKNRKIYGLFWLGSIYALFQDGYFHCSAKVTSSKKHTLASSALYTYLWQFITSETRYELIWIETSVGTWFHFDVAARDGGHSAPSVLTLLLCSKKLLILLQYRIGFRSLTWLVLQSDGIKCENNFSVIQIRWNHAHTGPERQIVWILGAYTLNDSWLEKTVKWSFILTPWLHEQVSWQ